MKTMRVNSNQKQDVPVLDVAQLISDLQDKYRDIFIASIQGEIFIYTPIGRKDWCDLCARTDLNVCQQEEVLCSICTVYPENYDFHTCLAGIPTALAKRIKDDSCLSKDVIINMIEYYRDEMSMLNNNITCIINEAFPNFDIEDIENWSWDKTIKYFTRAEWKLVNLRGLTEIEDIASLLNNTNDKSDTTESHNVETSEVIGASGLSKEELMQKQAQFPEIDWSNPSRD